MCEFHCSFVDANLAGLGIHPKIPHLNLGFKLLVKLISAKARIDSRDEFLKLKRLTNVVIRSEVQRLDATIECNFSSEHNNRDVPSQRLTAQATTDFKPVHLWHMDVQNNQLGAVRYSKSDPLPSARCDYGLEIRLEHFGDKGKTLLIIVDD